MPIKDDPIKEEIYFGIAWLNYCASYEDGECEHYLNLMRKYYTSVTAEYLTVLPGYREWVRTKFAIWQRDYRWLPEAQMRIAAERYIIKYFGYCGVRETLEEQINNFVFLLKSA